MGSLDHLVLKVQMEITAFKVPLALEVCQGLKVIRVTQDHLDQREVRVRKETRENLEFLENMVNQG